jgi:protein-L-isoaspartate(D-aspartate) O-methyltransferase
MSAIRLLFAVAVGFVSCSSLSPGQALSDREYERLRRSMVEEQLRTRDIVDGEVLKAMGRVPRHLFVPEEMRRHSYDDSPLPIGLGQTISQPYIVALMTQLGRPKPHQRALEIGTGSGYQAAVLAELVREVFSIEIVPELAERAAAILARLNYRQVTVRAGDGYRGWSEKAPFDIILITAAAPRVPQPLVDQLADRGRLIMPLGRTGEIQTLIVLEKNGKEIRRSTITAVRFVPMTGEIERP